MDVRAGLWRKLSTEELMLLNCGVGEDSWVPWTERSNQSILKEISPWISLEGMMLKLKLQYFDHLMQIVDKKLWCWEGLGAGGEGDDRGWDSWMASPAQWTWVSVNSGCWWRTGKLGVLWFMGSLRVRHDWETSLSLFTFMHWRMKWQATPVFLPRKFHGQRSLVDYNPWCSIESDISQVFSQSDYIINYSINHVWKIQLLHIIPILGITTTYRKIIFKNWPLLTVSLVL